MTLIRTPRELVDLARELKARGSFALDTEFIRENTYRPQLCLVQIATPDSAVAVDPFLVNDLSPLVELVADPSVEKVLHAGEQDMEIFFGIAGNPPRNVFDTQVAAALTGLGESISYGRMVETLLGVKLSKVETFTDWAKRPLSAKQVEYALDDVRYLLPVGAALRMDLERLGRMGWLRDELMFYEDAGSYAKDVDKIYRKVRSAAKLEPKELAILRELAVWREEEAERMNWPRGRILLDEALVEIARRSPAAIEGIAAVRGIHPQLLRRAGAEIVRRVELARRLPAAQWPPPIERRSSDPEMALVVDLLEVVLRSRAAEAQIAPAYLGSRKDLEELARRTLRPAQGAAPASSGGEGAVEPLRILSGWRRQLVGEALLTLLEGRSHVAVDAAGAKVDVVER